MKKIILFISILLSAINLHAKKQKNIEQLKTQNTIAAEKSINAFDNSLFSQLCNQTENVNYSAISIYSVLFALYKGADSQTQEQINNAINSDSSEDFENQICEILNKTENISNSIWYKKNLKIKNTYKNFLSNSNFENKPTDFSKTAKVRKVINSFISNKTNGLINNFLSQDLSPLTQLVLLNTLYFNQKWEKAFEQKQTYEEDFYKDKENRFLVPMMHKSDSFLYYEEKDFQIIELEYEQKKADPQNRYSMIIFLPKNINYDFSNADINGLIEAFNLQKKYEQVQLTLPKFDLSGRYDLVPVLQKLGVIDAFSAQNADFSKIFTNSKNIFVDTAIHQVRISVNEKETKAAAVTMIGLKSAGFNPNPKTLFTVDHPFCYVIRDNQLNINLFTGIIRRPE